jgi:translation initiation factor 1
LPGPTDKGQLVYASDRGRVCKGCGQAVDRCRCGKPAAAAAPSSSSGRMTLKIRLETRGRGGKSVTVIAGLPADSGRGEELLGELKRALATGGAACDGGFELRGDCRDRLRPLLVARGFAVKG